MQKKIIALAIAAAFSAPAFADSTVYGVVDAALGNVSADGQKSDTLAASGGLASSRIGVKAVEDLDNGMKAVVVLEYGLDTQVANGNSLYAGTTAPGAGGTAVAVNRSGIGASRQEMLAVAGGFGTFATGYLQTTGYDWAVKFDPTAGSIVSPLQVVTNPGFLIGSATTAARAQRALAYISPDFSGVSFAVNYTTALSGLGNLTQLSTATPTPKSTAYLVSVTYTGVPNLAVGGVYAKASLGTIDLNNIVAAAYTSTLSATDMALGASYDLGVVKLFGTYQTSKTGTNNVVTTAEDKKAYSFSVVAPVGPGAIAFSYAKNKVLDTGTVTGLSKVGVGTDMNANGMTVAWLQGLSKTTTFYATYHTVKQGNNTRQYSVLTNGLSAASLTAGGSSKLLAVGLNKKF